MNATKLTVTVVVSAMTFGCGDLPEPVISGDTTDDTASQTQTLTPEPPELTTSTTKFGYSSIPIRGTAESEAFVVVEGGAAATAAEVDATGFCADVALVEGVNTLSLYTLRADDSRSEAIVYTVTYDPSLAESDDEAEEETTGEVKDVARGRGVESNQSADGGSNMTDGKDDTSATFSSYPSLYIDLGQTYAVQKIEIQFVSDTGGDGTYADDYDVFSSVQASPTRPMDTETAGWSVLSSVSGASGGNGDGGLDTFEFGTPVQARWVGFTVNSNATSWYSFDWSIKIASIRVHAPEILTSGSGTSSGPPTCENSN